MQDPPRAVPCVWWGMGREGGLAQEEKNSFDELNIIWMEGREYITKYSEGMEGIGTGEESEIEKRGEERGKSALNSKSGSEQLEKRKEWASDSNKRTKVSRDWR